MKVVGRAMSTYGSRMFIIQCDAAQLPGLYSEVMDRRTKPVGKIMDVFGNVKSPYALVLSHGPCSVKPGEKVFARESRDSPKRTVQVSNKIIDGEAGCRK